MARAEALNFSCIFDSLEVRDRGARNGDVRMPKCLGDSNARLVANQNLLVTLGPNWLPKSAQGQTGQRT